MQHTLTCPPLHDLDLGANPTFNVVIAYEDFETGKHAKETCDYLAENLGRECELRNQMWKFDVLAIRKLREIAAADAAVADLVIVSCRGDELPAHTKAWIESWINRETRPMALVALFHVQPEAASRTCAVSEYLADAARRAGIEFFAHPGESSLGRLHPEVFSLRGRSAADERTLLTLEDAVRDSGARWSYLE